MMITRTEATPTHDPARGPLREATRSMTSAAPATSVTAIDDQARASPSPFIARPPRESGSIPPSPRASVSAL
jgi:hypothetical protein